MAKIQKIERDKTMRKKMDLKSLREFYQTKDIIDTEREFEMLNLKSGLRMICRIECILQPMVSR